jgi:hypothetical protein
MNSEESRNISIKIKELKEESTDTQDSLSNQLLNLFQMTGVKEFETESGEVREFMIMAKVKGRKK